MGADRSNPIVADLYGMVDAFDLLDYGQHPGLDLAARTASRATRLAARLEATFQPPVLGDTTLSQATMAARLLNDAEHGCRVALCSFGSFDHHVDLLGDQARSLAQVDDAARALFATLDPGVADRTVLLIHSEFGRRPRANGGGGTDHGTASYSFVVGPSVRGGLIGSHVALAGLDANGNPPVTLRHVDLIGSVLGGWLGADPAELLGTSTHDLGLFLV